MRFIGAKVPRVEDARILTGRGRYVDDLQLPRMLHAAFVRSPIAHARILSIDTAAACAAPGVVDVLTGADVAAASNPIRVDLADQMRLAIGSYHALATDKVRVVGDPVAMVVAETRYQAEDAAELVEVEYDPLPPVVDAATALDPSSPPIFDEVGTNVVGTSSHSFGDVDGAFAAADRVIRATFVQHRVANCPMETRCGVADFDVASGELTFHAATQSPHGLRVQLARILDLPHERVRVLAGDVGGSFGLKGGVFREDFCLAIASRRTGCPVKWVEDRSEHLMASGHAREETVEVEAAVLDDGALLGLKARVTMDQGAYSWVPFPATMFSGLMRMLLPGPYRVQGYSFEFTGVTTNKCTYVAYRGPWEVETWVRERLLDTVAHELGLDPAEVRRRNLVAGEADDRLVTGPSLAGISSLQSLDRVLELVDYDAFRAEQARAREEGRYLGIGFATFIEPAPGPPEMRSRLVGGEQARVRLEADGHLTVITAQAPHGQSHETTLAQVAADELGVPLDHVKVLHGDTRITPFSMIGTGGSRAATWASGAVTVSTRRLREKVLDLAAEALEIAPEDLDIVDGVIVPRGAPDRELPLATLAHQAIVAPASLPKGVDRDLEAAETFSGEGITGSGWSGGTHLCVVEVDLVTGDVEILRYLVVEDCGRVINPNVVDGQITGGVAQGIGAVLYEHVPYDDDGNMTAATFVDYLVPTAVEVPTIEIEHLERVEDGDLSYRGVGEGGAIVAPATLTNAIEDALLPLGVLVREQHLPPMRLLELAGLIPDAR